MGGMGCGCMGYMGVWVTGFYTLIWGICGGSDIFVGVGFMGVNMGVLPAFPSVSRPVISLKSNEPASDSSSSMVSCSERLGY
jgi:hypothetical protein